MKYYEEREKMASRRIEMNDKLKAVQLIKALGVDGAYKRDILSKVDFNKDPSNVYEDTKTAIRDIVGEKSEIISLKSGEDTEESDVKVNIVKPWQDKYSGDHGNRSRERGRPDRRSRSKSWDRRGGDRFRGQNRSFSREGRTSSDRSGDRSRSRGHSRGHSVTFQGKNRGRQDTTPGPGMSSVLEINTEYDRIFLEDDFLKAIFTTKAS